MANHILFDNEPERLFPFAYTRPVAEIRIGILTIREHWELLLETGCSFLTGKYLSEKFPNWIENENVFINGAVFPTPALVDAIGNLKLGQSLYTGELLIASFGKKDPYSSSDDRSEYKGKITMIRDPWDIFMNTEIAIKDQFRLLTHGRRTAEISTSNNVIGKQNIFIEDGAVVECSTINAETGPVYIGAGAEVMEGCMIRGPLALCEGSTLKMGAKVYGPTTIGPQSKVGGEVSNSVIFGYSNKAHDGFIGNSVIGSWCNLGADTNTSNLKNNYSKVKLWSYPEKDFQDTGQTFCGLFMGDHAKCSINTMFNTGTVAGVNANIFGSGFPPKFIPSFSWGGFEGSPRYKLEKAIELARSVYHRRERDFDSAEENIVRELYKLTESTEKV